MAKQTINIGSAANDGTGTTHRASFDICNDNFTELYDGKQDLDAHLTAIAALTPSNDDFIQHKVGAWTNRTVAQVQADLGIDSATTSIYYAIDNGITIGGSGAANTVALQTLINTVNAAGGGIIQFDYGTYNFNYTAASPWASYSATNRYAVQLKSGVYIRGKGSVNGTKLKLANTQMAGTTNGVHLFTVGDLCNGFGLIDLELDGNAAGQTGWTGGYGQGANDKSSALSCEPADIGVPNIYNCYLKNLYIHGWFGVGVDVDECENGIAEDIKVDNCGEGFQLVRCLKFHVRGFQFKDTNNVTVGDGFECSGGEDVSLTNFTIEGCSGGSAIDMATAGFRISNGVIRDCASGGVVIQNEGATNSLDSPIGMCSDVYVEDCVGTGFAMSGGDVDSGMDVTVSNCRATRCTRGFLVHKASGAVYSKGICYLMDCHAEACTEQGCDLTLASAIVSGGSFNNNGDYGILLRPANSGARTQTNYTIIGSMSCNNVKAGIGVEAATYAPYVKIAAWCDGNAPAQTFDSLNTDIHGFDQYSDEDGIQITNLRPYKTLNDFAAYQNVTGESKIRINYSPFVRLEGGTDGQIVELFAEDGPILLYDKDASGAGGFGTTPNLILTQRANQQMQQHDSLRLQFRKDTQFWYQIGGTVGNKIALGLNLADAEAMITANLNGGTADSAYILKTTANRGSISTELRNLRSGGTSYDYRWTAAGDAYTAYYDGTNQFSIGIDNSANAFKISNSISIGTSDILALTSTAATLSDAVNIAVGTTTGSKIGTATSQKIGFWNATPIVQPTTGVAAAVFAANAGTAVNDASTFDGYTLLQVVKALRNAGLLA